MNNSLLGESLLGESLLVQAGIKEIPLDKDGFLSPLYLSHDSDKDIDDIALIGCWYGQDTLRLSSTMTALNWTLKSKPFPKIYIVEASKKEDKRFFSEVENINYISRDIGKESDGVWMKEGLWSIGAKEAIKNGAKKLVFIDLDCSFVHQNWVVKVSESLDNFDVISPHLAYYLSGQKEGISIGVAPSIGYTLSIGSDKGHHGMSLGMTSEFFINKMNSCIPTFVYGGGDTFFWLSVQNITPASPICRILPHIMTEEDCRGIVPKPKIGHGEQIIVHHPHGPMIDRHYIDRYVVVRECFPRFRDGVAYLADGTPCFSDVRRGEVLLKTMKIIKDSGYRWLRKDARILCRNLLQEAGLELFN